MQNQETKEKEAWERESTWQSLAIALALGSIAISPFVVAWVFNVDNDMDRLTRVQIAAPLGVIIVAAITFCTVVWRGLISARQADLQLDATNLQRQQIDKLSLQIAASEENNLATFLQKGAELLAQEQGAHNAAGIATLGTVATAGNEKFAIQALNLVADFVQQNYTDEIQVNNCKAAIGVLLAGSNLGRSSDRELVFKNEQKQRFRYPFVDETITGIEILGVRSVTIEGGDYLTVPVEALQKSRTPYRFVNMAIGSGTYSIRRFMGPHSRDFRANFANCAFDSCRIRRWIGLMESSTYSNCNFSGCKVLRAEEFPDLRQHGNFYVADDPPIADSDVDWKTVLLEGRPNLKVKSLTRIQV